MMRPKRLPSNLYQFREGTGQDRCVLDCITSLQNGADLLWRSRPRRPNIEQIAKMVDQVREVIPNAKLAYNQFAVVQLDAQLPLAGLRCE